MSHITWHKVVDSLKEKFYVVASDLRGYGESVGPKMEEIITYTILLEQWQMIRFH